MSDHFIVYKFYFKVCTHQSLDSKFSFYSYTHHFISPTDPDAPVSPAY